MITRRTLHTEMLVVLGMSLGASAIWSILRIIERHTRPVPISQQTSALNTTVTPDRPWLDLAYQLVGIGLALVPVALVGYLLTQLPGLAAAASTRHTGSIRPGLAGLGLDLRRPWRDLGLGVGLAVLIGVPGLGFYLAARAMGSNTTVAAANLGETWWTVPVLVLSALQNGIVEEVIVVGYLLTRMEQAHWRLPVAIGVSAVIRGAYHLYQGFGGFIGNVVMGIVFALVWRRTRRVAPLVVAHTLIDVVAFIGYAVLKGRVGWL